MAAGDSWEAFDRILGELIEWLEIATADSSLGDLAKYQLKRLRVLRHRLGRARDLALDRDLVSVPKPWELNAMASGVTYAGQLLTRIDTAEFSHGVMVLSGLVDRVGQIIPHMELSVSPRETPYDTWGIEEPPSSRPAAPTREVPPIGGTPPPAPPAEKLPQAVAPPAPVALPERLEVSPPSVKLPEAGVPPPEEAQTPPLTDVEREAHALAMRFKDAWKSILAKWPELEWPPRHTGYVNAELRRVLPGGTTGSPLDPRVPLRPGTEVRLRLNIGELSADSQVSKPSPFPDQKLPKDINLDVMVTSSDFVVCELGGNLDDKWTDGGSVAHGRFFLPGDGGPATTPGGERFLNFRLKVPKLGGTARCRIGYYYRNVLVQSQQLVASVEVGDGFKIETDFTLCTDLTHLGNIPERPRISVLTNSNSDGVHQIVLRSVVPETAKVDAKTFRVNEMTVGDTIKLLRSALSRRAPTTKRRGRRELQDDLREIAPHGWTLYTQMPAQHAQMFQPLYEQPEHFVVQVLRPTSSGFVFPWALVYEIPLLNPERFTVCPLVLEWDDRKPLITDAASQCPRGPHDEDVLCPFGFWGFRYAIEQLSATDRPDLEIPVPSAGEFVVAQTQVEVDLRDLATHVEALRGTLRAAFPDARLREAKDKPTIRTALGQDLPLVYFYCHGDQKNVADPNTSLGVGKGESITAKDFFGWVVGWLREGKLVWDKIRPLVFVNACHSVAIFPNTLLSYLDAFVSTAHAAGVIGTEVKVHQKLAIDVAQRFFELFLGERQSVESALRTIRLEYLASGNLLGLVYTPYCWADLHVVPEKLPVTLGLDSPH